MERMDPNEWNEIYRIHSRTGNVDSEDSCVSGEGDIIIVCRGISGEPSPSGARQIQFGALNARAREHVYDRQVSNLQGGSFSLYLDRFVYTVPAKKGLFHRMYGEWESPCGGVNSNEIARVRVGLKLIPKNPGGDGFDLRVIL